VTVAVDELREVALLGGLDPEALATEFGTPLYVYDFDVVDRQVGALRAALPPVFDVAYALKANPSVGVVAHLADLGLGADVASGGELATALRAGIEPGRIVFTGPGKRDDELEAAVSARIRAVTVESAGELTRLEAIAARLGARVPILLRVATPGNGEANDSAANDVPIGRQDGGKFGIDPGDLGAVAVRAVRSAQVRLLGLHAFGASNVLDADTLVEHVEATMNAASAVIHRARAETGIDVSLELVDVGGGLGIPYADDEHGLDLDSLARRLADLAERWTVTEATRHTRVLVEPGRFLVGPAGRYLTRVVDRKTTGGREIVIVDGGIHHLVRPALIGRSHRIVNLTAPGTIGAAATYTIAGPLCSGLDVLSDRALLARVQVGDLLAVQDTGAYGYTESMPLFLSHPVPAEVAISDGRAALLRPRIEPSTWLQTQRLPAW
jgi:diaminopimelate decarboxylase